MLCDLTREKDKFALLILKLLKIGACYYKDIFLAEYKD